MKTCFIPSSPMEQSARKALLQVIDPEIGENIVDLGLLYGIEVEGKIVKVMVTMTSPACPMGEMILDDIHAALTQSMPDDIEFDIHLVWDPPWNPRMISEEVKQRLGWVLNESSARSD